MKKTIIVILGILFFCCNALAAQATGMELDLTGYRSFYKGFLFDIQADYGTPPAQGTCPRAGDNCPGVCSCTISKGSALSDVTWSGKFYNKRENETSKILLLDAGIKGIPHASTTFYRAILEVNIDNGICNLYREISVLGKYPLPTADAGNRLDLGSHNIICIYEKLGDVCCCKEAKNVENRGNNECRKQPDKVSCGLPTPDPNYTWKKYSLPTDGKCSTILKAAGIGTNELEQITQQQLNPLNFTTVPSFIGRLINILISLIGSIALVMYIWAGFLWMTAQGNQEKISSAQRILLWTTVGVVLTFSSYIIYNFIVSKLS